MFQIDPMSRLPVYEQIIQQVERLILTHLLPPGSQIPSVRSVSVTHSVNPRTILKAYNELDNRGLIQAVPGKGYFVCLDAYDRLHEKGRARMQDLSALVAELAMSGISKAEIRTCVEAVFSRIEQTQEENPS